MFRSTAAFLAGAAVLTASAGASLAADPTQFRAQPELGRRVPGPTRPPLYSYYGEYQYPVPFGYGYSYAPTRSHGFEYGYYGPRYSWSDPDWYYGPAFSYPEW
ncbi:MULTISPECIES: hypothetical protein [unclassified Methylobacterium]|jgi:hypothetical protein|uniref:hypothetical protein n=1 Tax=unclassified Methylobacterium TaxID=2615210 RepID=UPI001353621A|nr:hypothetical protein [Methylobacterium sp. 2A]MWV25559.1 hypothetical protein [Methylobacterium sp. 2A]